MVAYVNIPKRRRSGVHSRNSALIYAVLLSHFGEWKIDGHKDALDELIGRKTLRGAVESIRSIIASRRDESIEDLVESGVFSSMAVLERRGFWRVEAQLSITPIVKRNEK